MGKRYQIPAANIRVEIDVRKSRFICHIAQADSAGSAKNFIATIRQTFSDATHNCWAFQTEEPGSSRSVGCSDDGEPHGTAGKPMLSVLSHSNIGELVAVVTRYYGGTKLGTGGLARAYADSVKAAIEQLELTEKIDWEYSDLTFNYALQSNVEQILKLNGVEIISSNFDHEISIKIRFDRDCLSITNQQLSNISQGKLKILVDDTR